ncbi:LicD family protein [Anaerocolumna jejuensis]|uniref:LicD family protein n=1 Tax=Anaerocolumna jejuensis TaxID=259063 RepID=UPI003F7BB6AC
MICLDEKMLRQLQVIELEMMIEVERICKKCGIQYNIIAGTLLGAVRHKGFIPWDDDADIAMLRPEYEKFRKACETELDQSRFYFQDHRNTKGYRWGYGKLRRKDTLFLREFQEHMPYEQGVFIDIFPMDAIPNSKILRTFKNFECFCVRKILWSKVGKIADRNALKRKWYALLDKIPEDMVYRYYNKMIYKSTRLKSQWVRKLMFPTPNKECGYLRKWYAHSIDMEFENIIFKGMRDYKEYLSFKFGNYMSLPPENERKVHPVSDIKLIDLDINTLKK